MKDWTKEEMEKLYQEVMTRSATDKTFRKELLEDANQAIEKLTGEALPDGSRIKAVEQDPNYSATFVIPDFIGEELSAEELDKVVGGEDLPDPSNGILAIVSACAAAISVAGCSADACAAEACLADQGCGAKACAADGTVL